MPASSGPSHPPPSRRAFLRAGAAGAAAIATVTVEACGPGGAGSPTPTSGEADRLALRVSASLEVNVITTYGAVLTAAQNGGLGSVPAAFVEFGRTAASHHAEHLSDLNAILRSAGQPAQVEPNRRSAAAARRALDSMRTLDDALRLLLELETEATATYATASGRIEDPTACLAALRIGPVEAQHAAFLDLALGTFPAPTSFIGTDSAATADSLSA